LKTAEAVGNIRKAACRENSELKKIVADLTLDVRMLKELNSKKW